ncbi:ATP-binding protein [Shewanella sp.]|uniref:ATP-binding protein n=1 Tax=Shewanella sp. TaxID=50422 RepID=UPI00356ADDC5
MEQLLASIIEKVSNTRGDAFFNSITLALHEAINADYTFVATLDKENHRSNTIALVAGGKIVENMSYSLANTPCANAADDSVCCYKANVTHAFPDDQLLIDMGIEGYLGTPLHDLKGSVMGIIVALYKKPIINEKEVLELFALFSGRIEAELDRLAHEKMLEQVNHSLEVKVTERTSHLDNVIHELKETQNRLVESEKMAAMGNLVAGLAHEVNTPLGVAITSQSVLKESRQSLHKSYKTGELTTEELEEYLDVTEHALELLDVNLRRAIELVESFKRTAADQHSSEKERINVAQYYQQVLLALQPMLKPVQAKVTLDIPPDWELTTIPGVHSQTLTNLLSNSVMHGFKPGGDNQIKIRGEKLLNGQYCIYYSDNGAGLSKNVRKHIFEPFFTTARNKGGVGLGMSIVFNLISNQLGGKILLPETDSGFALDYTFSDLSAA